MKRTSKSFRFVVALLLVFSLAFPMSFHAYALTDGNVDQTSNLSNPIEQISDVPSGSNAEITSPYEIGEDTDKGVLKIESVQIVNGGEVQAKHRDYIKEGSGSDAGKYFITMNEDYIPTASMTDARIFKVSTTIDYSTAAISDFKDFDENNLIWTYGGKDLNEWKKLSRNNTFSGDQAISIVPDSINVTDDAVKNKITVTAEILFDAFYAANPGNVNVPYENYTSTTKGGYPTLQRDDGTSLLGTHELTLSYDIDENGEASAKQTSGPVELASASIKLNLYDSYHTWQEIEEKVEQLQKDSADNDINGRYVSVQSIGKSHAGRDIWNVVIASDEDSVNQYLNDTKTLMQDKEDAAALFAEIKNGSETDHKMVIYYNNVHPDETPASDALLELIDKFLYEENLSYRTYQEKDVIHHDRTAEDGYDGYTIEKPEQTPEIIDYYDADDILDNFILVFNITENPDGRDNLVRTNEYGFDLNRDAAYQTQKEAIALTSDLVKWDPVSMVEYHGYVTGLLIEPCTGPHDPNYEYDLYQKKMLAQGNALGRAMIGNTAYSQYLVPAADYNDGWDDGAPVYGPMFAMLYGVMGYTLEIPHATEDSKDACVSAGLALAYDCMDHKEAYFANKLEYKLRGLNNEDNPAVDKCLVDPYTGKQVGRPRAEGKSFFPEYYVIPVDDGNQKNPLEAYKTLEFLNRNGAKLSITKEEISCDGKKLPAGSYIIDMHQANRGFVNSMLSDGYDASNFADIYAEIVIAYPDMRNFDCITVWDRGIFDGKTDTVDTIESPDTEISKGTGLVILKNSNIDVIRLVNRLLSKNVPVYMLTSDLERAQKGDFAVDKADLDSVDYSDLLVYDIETESTPVHMEQIIRPNIRILGSATHSGYILDLLEFGKDDYKYVSGAYAISPDTTNVIIGFNDNTDVSSYVSGNGIGYIGIGTASLSFIKNSGLLPGFNFDQPGVYYNEGLVKAFYSDDNIITANYDRTDAAYIMNGTFITDAPNDGEELITVSTATDFFKAGWYPNHDVLKGEALAITGYTGSKHDVPITLFANNIFSKAHAQHTFNMFANAVFLTASEIELEPYITADPSSQTNKTRSLDVKLSFSADRNEDQDIKLTARKYKVTNSATKPDCTDGSGWLDYKDSPINLSSPNVYYIHAYAENTVGESYQCVFGPYNIGKTGGGGGGGSSTTKTTPSAVTTSPAVTAPSTGFTDISDHWAKASIEYVAGKKLFSGVSDKRFAPDTTMSRGMLVTVLGRAYGLDTAAYKQKSVFTDIADSAYYAPYVAWAYDNKIVSGTGNRLFSPDRAVTRGEMAVILTNYMKFIGKGTAGTSVLNYADTSAIPSWGLEGVQFVTTNGLMTGTSGNNFDFDGLSTRAQVATVMERLLKLIGE